jgi:epoxyqueuosine reductase QueG
LLSLPHAAVEAGLGTLGLNLQLLTPEFGPRVLLTAVLCSVDVVADTRTEQTLCLGPTCGRCLKTCPGDVVGHWTRDWPACDRFRSPHGFAQLAEHLTAIVSEPDPAKQQQKIISEDSFNLWQSILRGAGVITGCRRCQDVCPVGGDYAAMLQDALDVIPETTPEKEFRLADMVRAEATGTLPADYHAQQRWIGKMAKP